MLSMLSLSISKPSLLSFIISSSLMFVSIYGSKKVLVLEWFEKVTGIEQVRIRGIHLALPGYEDNEDGPTLEIFEYEPDSLRKVGNRINNQGFGHIAFHTDSVDELLNRLIEHGGKPLGEVVTRQYEGIGALTVVYATDPDQGNFIEIQNWS